MLSVLQIVDSLPSWILASVLGELCSNSRIADILPSLERRSLGFYTQLQVHLLFLVCWFVAFVWLLKSFNLAMCPGYFFLGEVSFIV